MEYGKLAEGVSKEIYINHFTKQNIKASLSECGLVIMPKFQYLAASPDALVSVNNEDGLLEIKNLSKHKKLTIKECYNKCKAEKKIFPLNFCNNTFSLKRNHSHYTQIQGQLMVTNRNWCDYMLRTEEDYYIERIFRNENFLLKLKERLDYFFNYCFLPELASPRKCISGIREPKLTFEQFSEIIFKYVKTVYENMLLCIMQFCLYIRNMF
jgi:hypothetical protein